MYDLAPEETARLIWLSLLGCVIVASLLGAYRRKFTEAVRHALTWVLIILGLVVVYGFKDQIMAQFDPARGVRQGDGQIALYRAADGHFRARVLVNDTPIDFMVDTGATDIVLSRSDAMRAGIDVDRLNFLSSAQTANGLVPIAQVRLDKVEFGDVVDRGVRATVSGGMMPMSLLGMRYLDRFDSYTVRGDTLLLNR